MRKMLTALLLLAGCGGEPGAPAPVQTRSLTGLYEGGGGRLCVIEADGAARFGLVAPGCSGAGRAERRGGGLRLVMAGEEACALDARIDGGRVTLPARVPPGCAYYCAPGASLAGRAFAKVGGSEADALGARDLVGDSLCD